MKRTVAIIGAGESKGEAIARKLANENYPLLLMGESLEPLNSLAEELRIKSPAIEVIGCAREAAWEADIIVPAVASSKINAVADKIREVSIGKTVVVIADLIKENAIADLELQRLLPHSKVVKASVASPDPAVRAIASTLITINN